MPQQLAFLEKPPRARPRVMMKMTDAGNAGYRLTGWKTDRGANFECLKCGHDDGWTFNLTITEIRRGLPCPKCNQ